MVLSGATAISASQRRTQHTSCRSSIRFPDYGHHRLLRARRERPRSISRSRAADERNELAAPHSITSLARATNTSDKETPSNAAALRLTAI